MRIVERGEGRRGRRGEGKGGRGLVFLVIKNFNGCI